MENLFYKIKKTKPNVKDITVERYVSNIKKLLNELDENDFNAFEDTDKVLEILDKKVASTKKNYLNSLIVGMKAVSSDSPVIEKYQEMRDQLNKDYFDEKSKNLKNDKEKEKMITDDEWTSLINDLNKKITSQGLKKKASLNKTEYNIMLQHLLVSLYYDYPFRNDFALMKVMTPTQFKKENDSNYNYFVNGSKKCQFVLNNYKTEGTYGPKFIDVDAKTCRLIRAFLKISPNKSFLVVDHKGTPLSRNRLTKFLTTTFQNYLKKPISTQMLRKSYLSNKYGETLEDMKIDSNKMGHSLGVQQKIYIKTD